MNPKSTLSFTRREALRLLCLAGGLILSGCAHLSGRREASIVWDELQRQISGTVTPRTAGDYETRRAAMIWNALKPARFPSAIVQVSSVADVQAAVRFAGKHGLKVAVRGGGHNWNGAPLREGGILLDLSRLNEVSVDVAARTANVQPVVTNRDLSRRLAMDGLAFPVGHCPTVTLSGYLLGGGFGWNAGEWGVACHNVTGMDIVTAEGELVHANERENRELFWAARGAGSGFFGVVTRYHLKLFPLPAHIKSSTLIFPIERAPDVAAWAKDTVAKLPKNLELTLLYLQAPPDFAARTKQICVVDACLFAQSEAEAASGLALVNECPVADCLVKELNVPKTFDALFDGIDRAFPHGKRYAVDTFWLNAQPVAALQKVAGRISVAQSQDSVILSLVLPPPSADAPPMPDGAFSMVGPLYVGCYAIWKEAADDAKNVKWLRDTGSDLWAETIGHYLGEVDLTADDSRARRSFAKPNWTRLQQLRAKYDPHGVFHDFLSSQG